MNFMGASLCEFGDASDTGTADIQKPTVRLLRGSPL
jgi:hypothetical protein